MVAAGACQRFRCLKAMENCRAWTTSLRHRSVEGPPSVNRLVKSWVLRIDGSSPEGEEYLSLGREPWFERPHSPLCGPPSPTGPLREIAGSDGCERAVCGRRDVRLTVDPACPAVR